MGKKSWYVLPVTGCAEAQTVARKANAKSVILFNEAIPKAAAQLRTSCSKNPSVVMAEITGVGPWVMLCLRQILINVLTLGTACGI
jgi:C4-dicarboxylate-specific signal transduction histidine kinase